MRTAKDAAQAPAQSARAVDRAVDDFVIHEAGEGGEGGGESPGSIDKAPSKPTGPRT